MVSLLLVALVILGAVILARVGSSAPYFDSSHEFEGEIGPSQINPVAGLPMMSGGPHGFDLAGNAYGFGDEEWGLGHRDAMAGPFDDFSSGVPDSRWPNDAMALEGMDHGSGISSIANDDFMSHHSCINPATGLLMISDCEAGFDVGGNAYGSRNDELFTHQESFGSGTGIDSHGFNDAFSSFGSGTDWS